MKTISRILILSAFILFLSTSSNASNLITAPIVNGDALECGGDAKEYEATIQLVRVKVKDESPAKEKRAVNAHITKSITANPAAYGITATCGECQTSTQTGCDLSIGGVSVTMTYSGSSGGNSYYKVSTQTIKVKVSCTICESDATQKKATTINNVGIKNYESHHSTTVHKSGLAFKHYPNPSNGNVTVSFDVKNEDNYKLTVRDIQGRTLIQENLGTLPKGDYKNEFDLQELSTGMYILSLESSTQRANDQLLIE
ncbi:MAG: T9SS type A sorting domain-containing protein [Flavobacteriales bacterium]|nr:T9SS type A sorting domain-containing protein [Flavobacteriales bacterium]